MVWDLGTPNVKDNVNEMTAAMDLKVEIKPSGTLTRPYSPSKLRNQPDLAICAFIQPRDPFFFLAHRVYTKKNKAKPKQLSKAHYREMFTPDLLQ